MRNSFTVEKYLSPRKKAHVETKIVADSMNFEGVCRQM